MQLWGQLAHFARIAFLFDSILIVIMDILWGGFGLSFFDFEVVIPVVRPPLLVSIKVCVLLIDSFEKVLHLAASIVILLLVF